MSYAAPVIHHDFNPTGTNKGTLTGNFDISGGSTDIVTDAVHVQKGLGASYTGELGTDVCFFTNGTFTTSSNGFFVSLWFKHDFDMRTNPYYPKKTLAELNADGNGLFYAADSPNQAYCDARLNSWYYSLHGDRVNAYGSTHFDVQNNRDRLIIFQSPNSQLPYVNVGVEDDANTSPPTVGIYDGGTDFHHLVVHYYANNAVKVYYDNVLMVNQVENTWGFFNQTYTSISLNHLYDTYTNDFRVYNYNADTTLIDMIYKLGSNTNLASLSGATITNLQNAGASILQLVTIFSIAYVKEAGYTYAEIRAGGVNISVFVEEGVGNANMLAAGFTQIEIDIALTQIKIHSDFTISDGTNDSAFVTEYISPDNPFNTPNVFASTDKKTTSGKQWQDIEISSTGQYQIAVVGGGSYTSNWYSANINTGNVWISTDYGENWTEQTGDNQVSGAVQQWISAMISGDGSIMMVKGRGNLLYRSTNYGGDWTKINYNYNDNTTYGTSGVGINGIPMKMATDGNTLFTYYNNGGSGGSPLNRFIKSIDGGSNWTTSATPDTIDNQIGEINASKSGQYVILTFINGTTHALYSADYGQTFIKLSNVPAGSGTSWYATHSDVACISNTGKICTNRGSHLYNIDVTTGTITGTSPTQENNAVLNSSGGFSRNWWYIMNSSIDGKYVMVSGGMSFMILFSSDYGVTFNQWDSNSPFATTAVNSNELWGCRFSDDNKYVAVAQNNKFIYVRKNTFLQSIYTPTTFAAKLNTDFGYAENTITAGGDSTTTDSTPYYRLYLQFANAVTLTNMPKDIFNIPFSDFSVKAGGQVNLRNVNLDADMTITTSYDTTSNTSTIPAGNYFINNFVSTIETDLVNYTLSYDISNALITFDGLAQDISMSITSNDTTVFDTSITEITTTDKTLPFITYGQPDPTLTNYIDNGITVSEFFSNGYTIPQLYKGGFIPDWTLDTDANHFVQSYVKDFLDISGSLALRENANLTVNGNIETKGNITIKNPIMAADLSLNHNMFVVGDISMNGNVTVGHVSMNGKVVDCSFTDFSIPESAFNGTLPVPDYTQPTILYEKGFDTTADVSMNANVQINNLKVDENIEFSDGTTMNTYDDNVSYSGIRDVAELSSVSVTQIPYDFTFGGDSNMNTQITKDTFGQTVISTDGSVSVIAIGGQSHPWGGAVPLSANCGLLITKDSGISWTKVNMPNPVISGTTYDVSTHIHLAISMSRNGQHMMCATTSTGAKGGIQIIHYSHDSGDSWTHANGIPVTVGGRQFGASCISDDGQYMYINTLEEYKIWYTHDSGSNWTSITGAGRGNWYTMVCSSDGSKIIGGDSNGGGLHISINYGVNWANISCGIRHQAICGNSDLSKVVASSHHWSNQNDYKLAFFNGGTLTDTSAWSSMDANSLVSDTSYRPKGGVCATSDLKHIIARCEDSTTKCIVSNDYGATWSKILLNEPCYDNITNMAISDGGTVIYRASNNTNIIKVNLPVVNVFKASTFTSLDISGNLTAGSFSTSSDYRIKTDISQLDETVTLDNLRPVKYLQTLINKPQYGLIAHELQEYYPDLVVGEKDGKEWQRVNYTGLIALLINEIKQLKRELTELENGM